MLLFHIAGCDDTIETLPSIDLSEEQLDILFVSQSSGSYEIIGVKDTFPDQQWNLTSIFETYGQLDPTWSPDGRKYAFTNIEDSYQGQVLHSNIYVFKMDCSLTKAIESITFDTIVSVPSYNGTLNARPDWHPDGTHMTYISDVEGYFNIYYSTLSDSFSGDPLPTKLTSDIDLVNYYCFPSFSQDGTRIVYSSSRTGREELWIMNRNGSAKTQLTDLPGTIKRRPRFSPSGDKIAFTSTLWKHNDDSLQIYTINPDGSGLDTITTSGNNADAAWSSDGTELLYSKFGANHRSYLYVIKVDGTNERKFLNDRYASYPIWRRK